MEASVIQTVSESITPAHACHVITSIKKKNKSIKCKFQKHTLNPHFITYYEFKKQVDYYGNKVIYAS